MSACKGLHTWMDMLPGSSGALKQKHLFQEIVRLKNPPPCPYKFPPSPLQTELIAKATEVLDLVFWNQSIRWLFKRLVTKFLARSLRKVNETDPVTMEPIRQPVLLLWYPQRTFYQFEAEAFARQIHKMLVSNDGHLPTPHLPRNPFTNEAIPLGQLIGLVNQCKAFGHTTWALEAFAKSHFNRDLFSLIHRKPLRLQAVRSTLAKVEGWDAIDTLYDFIKSQHRDNDMAFQGSLYRWALSHAAKHERIQAWRRLCLKFYEADILLEDDHLKSVAFDRIEARAKLLCGPAEDLRELRKNPKAL